MRGRHSHRLADSPSTPLTALESRTGDAPFGQVRCASCLPDQCAVTGPPEAGRVSCRYRPGGVPYSRLNALPKAYAEE